MANIRNESFIDSDEDIDINQNKGYCVAPDEDSEIASQSSADTSTKSETENAIVFNGSSMNPLFQIKLDQAKLNKYFPHMKTQVEYGSEVVVSKEKKHWISSIFKKKDKAENEIKDRIVRLSSK